MHRCIGLIGEQPQYLVGDLLQRWLNRSGVGRERGVLQPSDLNGGNLLRILRQHVAQINARQWYDNQPSTWRAAINTMRSFCTSGVRPTLSASCRPLWLTNGSSVSISRALNGS